LIRQVVLVVGAVVSAGACAAPALAAAPRVRVAAPAAQELPGRAHLGRPLARSTRLQLTIALAPRDPLSLRAFATAVSTPGTRQYGDFLGTRQFAGRFGATPAAVARVRRSLRDHGFRIKGVSANDLTMKVSATTAQVQRTFDTSIAQVRLANGRRAYTNTTAATLPAGVADDVQGVVGLDSAALPQAEIAPHLARRSTLSRRSPFARPLALDSSEDVTGGPQPCPAAAGLQDEGYTSDQIATNYSFSPYYTAGNFGQGQTIALFEEGQPYPVTDVAAYDACYTLGGATIAPSVSLIPVDGGPGPYDPNSSDDGEVTLDVDVIAGLAPKANILVYSAPLTATARVDTLSAIVSQDVAKTVSISYGLCEALSTPSVVQAENTLFQEAAAQGQTVISASGDTGDASCSQAQPNNGSLSVGDPASQPFNTSVGGTDLYSDASPPTQYVWNDGEEPSGDGGGSGGGLSQEWAMPSYQQTASPSLGVINGDSTGVPGVVSCGTTYCREVPDVAADASLDTGYIVYSNGEWTVTGGTSGASPLFAAFIALADASPTCRGLSLGFANPSLYGIASASYLTDFTDVGPTPNPNTDSASNDVNGINNGYFPTTTGYDMTTGLGTPIAATLGSALCAARAPVYTVTVKNPGAVTATVGTPFGLQVPATDSGGAAVGYAASGLPAGLAINPSTGVISGTPTTVQATTVTVSATDGYTNTGSTQFTFSVATPPVVVAPTAKPKPSGKPKASRLTIVGLAKHKPVLSFSLTGGDSKLKSLAVKLPKGLSFAKAGKRLTSHITIKAGKKTVKFRATIKKGVLTLTLSRSERRVTVMVTHPAISITRSEALKIKHRKVKRLVIDVSATNTRHQTSHQRIRLSKLR
jgi:subtilase family serine protease